MKALKWWLFVLIGGPLIVSCCLAFIAISYIYTFVVWLEYKLTGGTITADHFSNWFDL